MPAVTYNRAPWVPEAVASVLAQTYRYFEVLVVDDGSTDATLEVLAPFFREIIFLRHPRRRGVSAARNAGVQAARGGWLAFLDSDDLWLPEKLACQIRFLAANPWLNICQTEEIWLRRGQRVNPPVTHRKVGGHIFLPSLQRCLVSPSAVMLRRSLFEAAGGFDERLPAAEDYDLWLRLGWRQEVGLAPAPLVVKRGGHADQLSRQWGLDRYRIQALTKLLQEVDLPASYRDAAVKILVEKCSLFAQGCRKRGKMTEAAYYQALAAKTF
jgi:glycosyltransferase involved in cell wall biosynthesis